MPAAARALTPKRDAFVTEYLKDLNASAAAIRAGYAPRSASVTGCRLLAKARITDGLAQRLAAHRLSADRVLEELRRIGFSDVRQLFTANGDVKPLHELDDEVAASIASIEVVMKNAAAGDGKVDRVLKIKLWDKNRAVETLARHFALLVDRLEVSGDITLTHKIAAARARGARLLEARGQPAPAPALPTVDGETTE